ncbi:MAG: HAD-IIB family hydrolase [Candidatus Paceibacterota bacterium]
MPLPKYDLIVFDLDGTLAPSKSFLEPDMAELLVNLLKSKKVAVMSGGSYQQFQYQFLSALPIDAAGYTNMFLLPTSGTRLYSWKGDWHMEYAEDLTAQEKEKILSALSASLKMSGHSDASQIYGEQIEDRKSQITFSALGQNAPLTAKTTWDPDRKKREKIVAILQDKIPMFETRIGGTTSIDITRRGVNKSYGIRKLEEFLNIEKDKILFIGDALFPGGNDFPARASGVDCIQVSGPEEVKTMIRDWLGS